MSFLFGSSGGHKDPDLEAANRRQRQHFARDINDTRSLNAVPGESTLRRRSPWLILGFVTVFFLAIALANGGSDPVPLSRSCTIAALAVQPGSVSPGGTLQVRSTGPQDAQYLLSVDGTAVQGRADQQVKYTQTPAGPAYTLLDCVSPAFELQAPLQAGAHELALVSYAGGQANTVARATVTVNG